MPNIENSKPPDPIVPVNPKLKELYEAAKRLAAAKHRKILLDRFAEKLERVKRIQAD